MTTEILTTISEALAKAVAVEDELTEQLAYMVLERDHPRVRRSGTFEYQVKRLKGELVEAHATTDALAKSLARATTQSEERPANGK
jgi:hypothetical protein